MKKIMSLLMMIFTGTSAFSQDADEAVITTTNKHEIAVDATPLLGQFLNLGGRNTSYNPYYLMYRYHLTDWAIRARVGGSTRSETSVTNDSIIRKTENNFLEFRLGMERKVDFAKRWQFFYGLDLVGSTGKAYYKTETRPGETNINESQSKAFGGGPMMGFRFKISKRISLTTEANFLVYFHEGYNNRKYTPDDYYNQETTSEGIRTEFQSPTSLFFTYNF